jgi:5'-3' exonuclease
LPPPYLQLALGPLKDFFPDTFEIDLNGRTLPWEAAILIPFVDEDIFIEAEQSLFENGLKLSKQEFEKNTTSLIYPSYIFDRQLANSKKGKVLPSTLKSMRELSNDYTSMQHHNDYEKVGTFGFSSKLLEGVNTPCVDFPSLKWLAVNELEYTEKSVQKVEFKQCLAKIPQCKEDLSGAEFEDWIYKFAESKNKELYVHFPFQIEGFPLYFEDPYSIYQINGDDSTGQFYVTKLRQNKSKEEFQQACKRLQITYLDKGIQLGDKFNTLVTLSTVIGTEYDEFNDQIYKLYSEIPMTLPLNLCMRKRGANHYFNLNDRTNVRHGRIKLHQDLICFN